MGLVAFISRESKVGMEEWKRYANSDPALVLPISREIVNPFTNEKTTSCPSEGEVSIVCEGSGCGAIVPSSEFSETGELHIYAPGAPSEHLRQIISDVARALNAEVFWLTDEAR